MIKERPIRVYFRNLQQSLTCNIQKDDDKRAELISRLLKPKQVIIDAKILDLFNLHQICFTLKVFVVKSERTRKCNFFFFYSKINRFLFNNIYYFFLCILREFYGTNEFLCNNSDTFFPLKKINILIILIFYNYFSMQFFRLKWRLGL